MTRVTSRVPIGLWQPNPPAYGLFDKIESAVVCKYVIFITHSPSSASELPRGMNLSTYDAGGKEPKTRGD